MTHGRTFLTQIGTVHSGVAAFLLLATCALSCGCNDQSDADIVAYENLPQAELRQSDAASDSRAEAAESVTDNNNPDASPPVDPDDPAINVVSETTRVDRPNFTVATADTTSDVTLSADQIPADSTITDTATAVTDATTDNPEIPAASYPDLNPEDLDNGTAAEEPRNIELLIPRKRFRRGGADGSVRVSYDDIDLLKILNMEPVPRDAADYFPDWLKGLDGQRIVIRGFMYPTYQLEGLESFTLARDNGICCFVRKPKIYDVIRIQMRDGVTADYVQNRPIDLVGVFHINPTADEHELYRLYSIDDAVVLTR